jgi:hypothetical protein
MRRPIARSINGIVFGLSTPRRHGNSKSSNFLKETELEPLGKPAPTVTKPNRVGFIRGKKSELIIPDEIV